MNKMASKRKWSIVSRLMTIENILYLLCGLCCLYQIKFIVIKYLSFDYITRIHSFVPDRTPLPDLVFCIRFIELINVTKFISNYPDLTRTLNVTNEHDYIHLIRSSPDRVTDLISSSLTIKQLTQLLYPKEQIINKITVIDRDSKSESDLCLIKSFYISISFCILTACSYRGQVSTNISMSDHHSAAIPFFMVEINNKYLDIGQSFGLTLVPPNTLPWEKDQRWLDLDTMSGPYTFTIIFTMFLQSLLPPPYQSQCHNYRDDGHVSQAEARNDCLNRHSLSELGVNFDSAVIADNLDQYFARKLLANNSQSKFVKLISRVADSCIQLTSKIDCSFISYPIQEYDKFYTGSNMTYIVLEQIREPVFTVSVEPQ
ncbi:uncharacterized protein LOC128396898 [Panonychus citri]|uniref:uncharacterized protein LOC128396898 n=1 Tax=Panonychus citri TaxID=50023 RepID=UPI002307BA69|nr:uncharacterized protein LOC128396898 [Panonychus citri]